LREVGVWIQPSGLSAGSGPPMSNTYRHEALLYSGLDDFLQETLTFIEDGIKADEPVLVVLDEDKIDAIQFELGPVANPVVFADMTDVGANPARIIGLWHSFLAEHRYAQAARGIGEPIYAGRSPAELEECQLHESLLNVALRPPGDFWLLCPYDVDSLPDDVVAAAFRSHPYVVSQSQRQQSLTYRPPDPARVLSGRLSPVPSDSINVGFGHGDLAELRHFVARYALDRLFVAAQVGEIEIVVNEIATNAIQHGGGHGIARFWEHDHVLYFEVDAGGRFSDPLVGRIPPGPSDLSGRGLWIANQLCDLLQVRNHASGTVVRGQFRRIGSA
jgi:anti-sigma regulatory factor (Ser/Thr protein kinase)